MYAMGDFVPSHGNYRRVYLMPSVILVRYPSFNTRTLKIKMLFKKPDFLP